MTDHGGGKRRATASAGQFGALDRKAILDADLSLMMASEPALVADHAFTTGRIGQTSFEQPLQPSTEIIGIFDGFGCFPEKMPAAKNTGDYIPDDFEHEIGTTFLVKDRGLVVLTSCSHRGVINTVRQAIAASGIDKVHAVIGGFHIVPPLGDDYIGKTIEEFGRINPDYLITGHCTVDRFLSRPVNARSVSSTEPIALVASLTSAWKVPMEAPGTRSAMSL
jgi:7,8-dihydropterin-6-yl-methyl-4-(beta-D-ribofuranosyl)aminobenzene 5'-phosphate synthase